MLFGSRFRGTRLSKLRLFFNRLIFDFTHAIQVGQIAALEALYIPAVRVPVNEEVPSTFRAAFKFPHPFFCRLATAVSGTCNIYPTRASAPQGLDFEMARNLYTILLSCNLLN